MTRGVKLYTKDSKGKIRYWLMETNPVDPSQYRSVSGIEGAPSSEVASGWYQAKATNVGRANERTPVKQALFDMRAEYDKKIARKYHTDLAVVGGYKFFSPMLAKQYDKTKKLPFPVFVQPKLDGLRCIANRHGLWSRQGKPFVATPHVWQALAPVFNLMPDAIIDGELYNHDLKDDFNKIVSLVKKQNPAFTELDESARLVQYHVYDIPKAHKGGESFKQRHLNLAALINALGNTDGVIRHVPTSECVNQIEIDANYGAYLEDGYEGQIVRLDAPYENKRSGYLLKRKEFQDAEFPIVAIEEGLGNWGGAAKRVVCRLPDGRTFGAGMRGHREYLEKVLAEPNYQEATVRFFAYTPDGIPRFPVVTALHETARDY